MLGDVERSGRDGVDVAELAALIRRVVAARVSDADTVDDIVQETLARLLAARGRLDDRALGPYAIVVARNLVASHWRRTADTVDATSTGCSTPASRRHPTSASSSSEEAEAVRAALDRSRTRERDVLVGHEVDGRATASLADDVGSTPGAVAAQLNRSRAKLRVEYLLELAGEPPTPRCRPVLLSLSAGDRRRQAELDVGLPPARLRLLRRPQRVRCSTGGRADVDDELRVAVRVDADIVVARQRGRELATRAGSRRPRRR